MQQFTLIYNYSWSINLTIREQVVIHDSLFGSVQATLGAIYYLLLFTSTVYHLLFMSFLRLYAISSPIKYRTLSDVNVVKGLGVVWIIAIVVASSLGTLLNLKFLQGKLYKSW